MEVTREMARTMAEWWGDQIRGNVRHDNGDHDNLASVFAGLLADSMMKTVDEVKVNKFVDILTEKILKAGEKDSFIASNDLYCDYCPPKFLADAAKEAGINPENFPWKTGMGVYKNEDGTVDIRVTDGYQAPWVKIWPKGE